MNRTFNIAGPCDPKWHYMLDSKQRLNGEVMPLIDNRQYFVIHAARQSGKTTLLFELTDQLHKMNKYYTLYCSLENAYGLIDAEKGILSIINAVKITLENQGLPHASDFGNNATLIDFTNSLQKSFTDYCRSLDKPLIVFFDEVDCLSNQTLISFLRQLRNGYVSRRQTPFISSLALVGMRNIRDYRDEYRLPEHTLGTSSPFNIAAASMTLRNFTEKEVEDLYYQHTMETGQIFDKDAVSLAWRQTQGQPWLVNAIAQEIVIKMTADDPRRAITGEMVSSAIKTLILRRDTHFDSLYARLREDRVRNVIEPVLTGDMGKLIIDSDDYLYVKDLGLIRDDLGKIEPANPIYGDIIVRDLNKTTEKEMESIGIQNQIPRYLKGGAVNMDCLLSDFQVFWRENSDIWRKKYDYQEAAPQLILQAFLQKILNGGGQIIREMAAGTGRADLCVVYRDKKYPIEMKIRHGDNTYTAGTEQILEYMDTLGCNKGWLVVFDQRVTLSWDERLFSKEVNADGKIVAVYGC